MDINNLHTNQNTAFKSNRFWRPGFKVWQKMLYVITATLFYSGLAAQTVPTVNRNAATNINATTVTIGGTITSDGGAAIIASGVVYSTTPGPVLFGAGVVDSTTNPLVITGSYSINPVGLLAGTKYYYKAYATNGVGTAYSIEDSFTTIPVISTLPYSQNFDGPGSTGWTSGSVTGTNDWVIGTPAKTQINAAFSAPNCWVTRTTGFYSGNTNIFVISPQFDFTSQTVDPVLSFRHNFVTDIGWHGGALEISINGGVWTKVDNTLGTGTNFNTTNSLAWYNNTSTNGPMTPNKWSNNSTAYSSSTGGWIQSQTSLTGAAGQSNVRIRFRFACDGFGMNEGWAIDNIDVFPPSAPFVITGTYSNLTNSSVTAGGNITGNGGSAITASGIVMGNSPNPVRGAFGVIDSPTNPLVAGGAFTKNFTGLFGGSMYYYRAYAVNAIGTSYGVDSTFITNSSATPPTVLKIAATNVKATTAMFGGNITLDGGSTVTASGVVYSTSPNPFLFGFGVVDSTTNPVVSMGTFSFATAGLMPSTKYYFKAYATNSVGTAYSSEDSFTTAPVINWLPYAQNFDTVGLNTGWTSGSVTGTNDWVIGAPSKTQITSAYSTPNCWVTNTTSNYSGNTDIYVESPQFDFSAQTANPVLRFRHNFLTDIGWHGAVVEISINGGAYTKLDNTLGTGGNFNTPASTGWYNSNSANGPMVPNKFSATSTAYSTAVNGWIQSITQLTGAAGQANVKIRFRFACDGVGMTSGWAIDNIEVIPPVAPTVITGTFSNLTTSGVTLGGNITSNGNATITASGVVISAFPSPVRGGLGVVDSATNPLATTGNFTVNVAGLSAATTYYYRAYAVNGVGTSYGADSSFTTMAAATVATINTTKASLVQGKTARVGGLIANDGGSSIISSGVVFSTTLTPVVGGFGVVDSTTNPVITTGAFAFNLANLTPSTKYYFRAYAINGVGTAYGNLDSFSTAPVVATLPYSENFDAVGVNTGWDTVSTGGVNDWVLGTPAKTTLNGAFSAPNAWVTKLTGTYNNGVDAAVVSPQFDFTTQTADPVLRFRHKFSAIAGIDGAVVEISLNGGTSWTQLDNTVGTGANFNTPTSTAWNNNIAPGFWTPSIGSNFSGLSSGYSSQAAGWIQSTVRLTGAAGQSNVKVRMRFATTTFTFFGTDQGWEFDNVEVFPPTAPSVTTGTNTNVTLSSATLAGSIVSDGNATITASGIVYSTSPSPVRGGFGVVDSSTNPVITSGAFTRDVTGLIPSTMYYYRAYAVNGIGTSYGPDSVFFTPASAVPPSVLRIAATNVNTTTATLGGNITSDGGASIIASGIVYSTTPNPLLGGFGVIDSTTTPLVSSGIFSVNPAGLMPNTKYYFKAYATNSAGTGYSIEDSFNTAPIISVLPYTQNFDAAGVTTGWRSGSVTGTNDWVVGTPAKTQINAAFSAPNCWVTRTTGNFTGNTNIYVESPQFDLTSVATDPVVRFRHNFLMDIGWHGAVLEISINGGAYTKLDNVLGTGGNFNTAASTGWYNNSSTNGPMTPSKWSSGSTVYSTATNGWILSQTALTGAAGQSNVRFRFRFACDGAGLNEGWAIDNIEVALPTLATVVTGTKTAVISTGATLAGNITSNGNSQITASGIVLSTSPAPVRGGFGVVDSTTSPVVGGGSYTRAFGSLTAGMTYYYRAYAVNALGTAYGADSTFTTPVSAVAPTVTTAAASAVLATSATVGGTIVIDGGSAVTSSGVIYGTSSANLTLGSFGVTDRPTSPTISSGSFSFSITPLVHSTKYYFRAYAGNSAGTGYGDVDSFATPPVVSSFPYTQNFDLPGVTGWVSGSVTGTNDWVVGTPAKTQINAAYSAPNCWITKTSGSYSGNTDIYVESPQFDLTSVTTDPVIRFRHNFLTDIGWHGGVIEMSVNGGAYTKLNNVLGTGTNFNTPASFAWYNNNSANGPMPPSKWSGTSTAYATSSNGWIQSGTVLTGAAGQANVKVRFRFACDGVGMTEGWAIDNIEVTEIVAPLTSPSNVTISPVGNTTATVNWTNGNGQGRIVVARLASTTAIAPTNMTLYRNVAAYATADSTGAGNYVVYNGTGTSVNVTGLTVLTGYTFDVYEYNGSFMHVRFNTIPASSFVTTTPVRLVSFTAANNRGDGYLTWATSGEKNNAGFSIERSVDGRTFAQVAFVKGAGNSNTLQRYSYSDGKVFNVTGANQVYYRLKQVDRDGRFEYSSIVSISDEGTSNFKVSAFPVPFVKDVTIKIVSPYQQNVSLQVTDIQGRTIAIESIELNSGETEVTLNSLNELQAGVYFIKVTQGNDTQAVRIVKTN
jgi:hypothetical protein